MATSDDDGGPVHFGTAAQDAPITRNELERALRYLNLTDLDLRESLMKLAGQVVSLTDELVRRIDHVEPEPAPAGTPADPPTQTVEAAVAAAMPETTRMVRVGDERAGGRVAIDVIADKYAQPELDIPCAELVHLCKARCCSFTFSLSTQDLDEGVIRWDYGQPYLIRQRSSDGYCVHHDPDSRGCSVHAFRPRVCRVYDCRKDERIWADFDKRIPAGEIEPGMREVKIDLLARAKSRFEAIQAEKESMRSQVADARPSTGPAADATIRPSTKTR